MMSRASTKRTIKATIEAWELVQPFVISRGAKTHAHVVVCEVFENGLVGRGEAVPYGRYGESPEGVVAALENVPCGDLTRVTLGSRLPAGAARNALDLALWDLEAKHSGTRVYDLIGAAAVVAVQTAFTLSLGSPGAMAEQARGASNLTLLKLKLGGGVDDIARMKAVRSARPDARLVADANEAWAVEDMGALCDAAASYNFEFIEQPLCAGEDEFLSSFDHCIPICADESVHTCHELDQLVGLYDAVNIKLDKAGGLSEALEMCKRARKLGFKVMLGSMVSTSLGVAPALVLSQWADWVDLDGPLLLKNDRACGLKITDGWIAPCSRELWG